MSPSPARRGKNLLAAVLVAAVLTIGGSGMTALAATYEEPAQPHATYRSGTFDLPDIFE